MNELGMIFVFFFNEPRWITGDVFVDSGNDVVPLIPSSWPSWRSIVPSRDLSCATATPRTAAASSSSAPIHRQTAAIGNPSSFSNSTLYYNLSVVA